MTRNHLRAALKYPQMSFTPHFCNKAIKGEKLTVKELELHDWNHFREYVAEEFSGTNEYIFRGHADRNWKLESTLTRLVKRVSGDIEPDRLDATQLQNFRMKIRGLRGSNPQPLDDNGLWSLGQHYGLCTPLLDWTESVYIAAYFAFEDSSSCQSEWRTIYALNRQGLIDSYKNMESEGVSFFEPLHDDNKRIIAQAGLFTKIPTGSDLETWLTQRGLGRFMKKLHIEDTYRLDAINDLKLMNIVGSSIYPDLHGASISCNMLIENISENHEQNKATNQLLERLGNPRTDKL